MRTLLLFVLGVIAALAFTITSWKSEEANKLVDMISRTSLSEKVTEVSQDQELLHMLQHAKKISIVDEGTNVKEVIRNYPVSSGLEVQAVALLGKKVVIYTRQIGDKNWKAIRSYNFSKQEWDDLYEIGGFIQENFDLKYINRGISKL